MSHEEFTYLMTRKLSGEASEEELRQLEKFLASEKDFATRFNFMQQYWNNHEKVNESDVDSALQKLRAKMEPAPPVMLKKKTIIFRPWAVAASLLIIGGIAALVYFVGSPSGQFTAQPDAFVEKNNTKGTKSILELGDGTKVWLNADSRLQYPPVFAGPTREVHLTGEAFFDVKHNPARPFIIHLENGTVKVLGTSFNIRAYENENRIETSVASGKVAFIPKYKNPAKKTDTLLITPDRKLRYVYSAGELEIKPSSASEDKAWTEGRLIFKSMTWEEIAFELERSFGKKIVFEEEEIKEYRLTGSFQHNSLEEILYYLARTADFDYEIRDQEVNIFYLSNRP